MAKIRLKNTGKYVAALMRGIAGTLECRIKNTANIDAEGSERYIWAFWHDSMFLMPWMWQTAFPGRSPVILTSPSGDGEIIAQTCAEFEIFAARGSSSRRGAQAFIELARHAKQGKDIGITPDGPRGPKHKLNPGVIKLAQLTGFPVVPIHVDYTKVWKFNTWDEFQIPRPFSKVSIEFREPVFVPRDSTEEQNVEYAQVLETRL